MNSFFLENEAATLAFGAQIAKTCPARCLIFLTGHLGAGKTTFVRGFLRSLGYTGAIKSPTYTLVEPYDINGKSLFHFDLYRIQCAEELETIGLRDYLALPAISLIEWPEHGKDFLPEPDIFIEITIEGTGRRAILRKSI